MPLLGAIAGDPASGLNAGVRESGEVESDRIEREAAYDVVIADPEHLALAVSTQRQTFIILRSRGTQGRPKIIDKCVAIERLRARSEPVEKRRLSNHQLAQVLTCTE